MNWSLALVTGPVAEPISSTEAKLWLRLDHAAEDTLVTSLIQMVREQIEEHGIAVLTQTWDLRLDRFPSVIRIPMTPVQSVSSITYIDANGDTKTLAPSGYTEDVQSTPARIVPAYGKSWPSTRSVPNAVTVQFIAGYGEGATPEGATPEGATPEGATPELPGRILQAMRLALYTAYTLRNDHDAAQTAVARILDNYRVYY